MFLLPFVLWSASEDALKGRIPNKIIITAYTLCGVFYGSSFLLRFCIAIFFLISFFHLTGIRLLGAGDQKLGALICGAAGYSGALLTAFTALFLAATVSIFMIAAGRKALRSRIRLGPYIAAGYLIALGIPLIN